MAPTNTKSQFWRPLLSRHWLSRLSHILFAYSTTTRHPSCRQRVLMPKDRRHLRLAIPTTQTYSILRPSLLEPVEAREFPVEKEAVVSIDFNEDRETQVFTSYQGKIIVLFAAFGDDVKRGQKPFTIDSPIYWRPSRT